MTTKPSSWRSYTQPNHAGLIRNTYVELPFVPIVLCWDGAGFGSCETGMRRVCASKYMIACMQTRMKRTKQKVQKYSQKLKRKEGIYSIARYTRHRQTRTEIVPDGALFGAPTGGTSTACGGVWSAFDCCWCCCWCCWCCWNGAVRGALLEAIAAV